ncbi:protein FAM71B-like isoform X2 [Gallus gallus]|uniref:protein FAM71B-like isoform X2 n=1 Tax=Gallus gallus TaxID=9031 RepID=UPI001AE35BE4|nr:protein FAM71B-like isoform X2 [Gallus gallus]XP_046793000.1 protein FAM71B-like isoform X2 [Gallus gallus]
MEVQRAQEARPAGPLQRLLQEGEFGLLSHTLILESNFFQVGRHGEVLNVSKRVQEVTMGVAETGPATGVPNVILMAVPAAPPAEGLELTRLLPLQCVKLAVYGRLQHCLRLRFPTGRKVYLQLCPGPRAEELFLHWAALVTVLPVPGEPSIHPTPAGEPVPGGEACSTGVTQPEVEAEVEVKVPATDLSMGKIGTTGEIAGTDEAPPASSTPEDTPNETPADATRCGSSERLGGTRDPLATSARKTPTKKKKSSSGWRAAGKWAFWRRGCRAPKPTPAAGDAH